MMPLPRGTAFVNRLLGPYWSLVGRLCEDRAMTESRWRVPLSDVAVDDELVDAVLGRRPLRLVEHGPAGRGVRARVRRVLRCRATPSRSRTAPRRFTWRCWPSVAGLATRSSCRR